MTYRFSAPAKVNVALRVVGRRADGRHRLWTVMTFFPLYDTLTITCPAPELRLTCQPPVTGEPEENLVWRAAHRLREETGITQGATLHLEKRIPHGAGLGGGSSDAATTLLALNGLWRLNLPVSTLMRIGVQLGADIPLFLGGTAALAQGIGEQLTPLPRLASSPLVVIHPNVVLSTGRVFQHFASHHRTSHDPLHAGHALPESYTRTIEPLLINDLEPTATQMVPVLRSVAEALQAHGAQATLMSGSGSALLGLFSDAHHAERATTALQTHHPLWHIVFGQTFNIHPFANEWKSAIE